MKLTLIEAARAMGGQLLGEDREFSDVSIDTRSLGADQLFFALSGPNFDGHEFLDEAKRKDAAAAVVAHACDTSIRQIVVEDVRAALGRLGSAWRDAHDVTAVGITGSNGKTTLKEMIGSCLRRKASTLQTAGNLNNDLGVPLMLMRLTGQHQFAVFEMGANHAGEIAYLTSLVKPQVVVLSNAGPAHLEGFGSLDGVAEAKGEIFRGNPRPQCAIVNADDHYFDYWKGLVEDIPSISFGLGDNADVYSSNVELNESGSRFTLHTAAGEVVVELPLAGIHNVRNACAAAAVVGFLGLSNGEISDGLAAVDPVDGRLKPLDGPRGSRLFDDSYNANPTSVTAAAEFIASLAGKSVVVLGDMLELGEDAAAIHRSVGQQVHAAGVDTLFAVGDLSRHTVRGFGDGAEWFKSIDHLVEALQKSLDENSNVLVKGSRSTRMERVIGALTARNGEAA